MSVTMGSRTLSLPMCHGNSPLGSISVTLSRQAAERIKGLHVCSCTRRCASRRAAPTWAARTRRPPAAPRPSCCCRRSSPCSTTRACRTWCVHLRLPFAASGCPSMHAPWDHLSAAPAHGIWCVGVSGGLLRRVRCFPWH